MPSAIPPSLAAYIQASLAADTQILITSVLSTPPTWLCLRFIYAALHGIEDLAREYAPTRSPPDSNRVRPIIFVSLLRPLDLWIEMGRKLGLDLTSLLTSRRIVYIDGLTMGPGFTTPKALGGEGSRPPTVRVKSLALDDIRDTVNTVFKTLSTPTAIPAVPPSSLITTSASTPTPRLPPPHNTISRILPAAPASTRPIVLVDGIDFVLASQPSVTTIAVESFLSALRAQCHALVLAISADSPLLHSTASGDDGTPLERNHAHFLTSMAHRSQWVWQLRGLDTGSAKDVTGVVRINRGGDLGEGEEELRAGTLREGNTPRLPDAEWLYRVKGDGSLGVWGRGE